MAETQEGGIYIVGKGDNARFVDANGKETTRQKVASTDTAESGSGEAETWPYPEALAAAGFTTWEQIASAKDEDLLAVDGIGQKRLSEIRAYKGA